MAEDLACLEQMVLALAESIGAENLSVQRIGERKPLPVIVIENALHRRPTAILGVLHIAGAVLCPPSNRRNTIGIQNF